MRTRSFLAFSLAGFLYVMQSPWLARADFVFETATYVPPPVNSGYMDVSPTMPSNGLELYVESTRPGGGDSFATWAARRGTTSEPFGVPQPVTPLDHASISRDGLSLYANENGPYGYDDIYVMTRPSTAAAWGPPQLLDGNVNSSSQDRWCEISSDGLELYTTRGPGVDAWTEIWVCRRLNTSQPFGPAVKLPANINDGKASAPALSDDGLAMFFASSREGGFGGYDIWITTRSTQDSAWGEPLNAGPEINTSMGEWGPEISSDGGALYFSRGPANLLTTDQHLWEAHVVPEPSTFALLSMGTVAVFGYTWRRRRGR